MKLQVTPQGVIIPKVLLEGFKEVEIRKNNGMIIIIPLVKEDPIFELGKNPVLCGISDASENHDKYLYGNML